MAVSSPGGFGGGGSPVVYARPVWYSLWEGWHGTSQKGGVEESRVVTKPISFPTNAMYLPILASLWRPSPARSPLGSLVLTDHPLVALLVVVVVSLVSLGRGHEWPWLPGVGLLQLWP